MKSEFPETKFTRFGKKFGWIFSPLLFILLLGYTLFTAQNLSFDPIKGDVTKYGNVHLKEVSEANVFFDGTLAGKTSTVLKTDKISSNQSLNISVIDEGKRNWEKTVKPREGYVSILYPIMYPKEIEFRNQEFNAYNYYKSPNPNLFFYEKIEDERVNLYRYEAQQLLFTINIRNDRFADISGFAKKSSFESELQNQRPISNALNERKILPGYTGRKVALIKPNEAIYILNENGGISTIPGYVPSLTDSFYWSEDDEYAIFGNSREILSFSTSSNTVSVIHRVSQGEQLEVQLLTQNTVIYKLTASSSIDLYENNFLGNNRNIIDIPNIEGLRKNNLVKVYDLVEKQNSLLVQAEKNIYLFNLTSFELKKFNKFEGEKIVIVDPEWETVITVNTQSENQFRYYNLDTTDSRTFTIEQVESTRSPDSIQAFNYAQNLGFDYGDKVFFTDSDGANRVEYTSSRSPKITLAVKEDRNILLGIAEINTDGERDTNGLKLRFERFGN